MNQRPRVAMIVTTVLAVKFFLAPHLRELSRHFDVTLIVKVDHPELLSELDLPVRVLPLDIERKIAPFADLRALLQAMTIFRREKFDLVHTVTPKAGLIGMLAAYLCSVPGRMHTFQGEVWATQTGLLRRLMIALDKLVARLATDVTVVSYSERDVLRQYGIVDDTALVLADGSITGVDLDRFNPDPGRRALDRAALDVDNDEPIILYLGRLNVDKGLLVLAEAFSRHVADGRVGRLVFVGPDEQDMVRRISATLSPVAAQRTGFFPLTSTPERALNAADLLVLPSAREGLGLVILEAAAFGIPAVASNIYGITDAVVDGATGLLFRVGDEIDLANKLGTLLADAPLRQQLGRAARTRVVEMFAQPRVVQSMLSQYRKILSRS